MGGGGGGGGSRPEDGTIYIYLACSTSRSRPESVIELLGEHEHRRELRVQDALRPRVLCEPRGDGRQGPWGALGQAETEAGGLEAQCHSPAGEGA